MQKKRKMSRKYKRSNWKKAGKISIGIFCVLSVFLVGYEYCCRIKYQNTVLLLENRLEEFAREVYVATEKLPKGSVLTEDKVDRQIRYLDYPQDVFITENDLGKELALDIAEGTCLMDMMVCHHEENVREFFLDDIDIPSHIQKGDRVDLRIRYGNAEEYVILADKVILECCNGDGMVIALTEEECLLVSSAISDTREFTKTKLYVVEYPEYDQKEKSRITYLANRDVLLQLGSEKSKGESRTALEKRIMQKQQ